MATSGTVYSTYAKSSRLYVSWSQTGQSVSGNYTNISWTAGIIVGGSNKWYSNAVKITSVYINGSKVSSGGTYSNLTSNGTYQKLSGTATIPHNADGTKTFSVSISGWFYEQGSPSGSNSFTLTTIPRVSDLSLDKTSVPADEKTTVTATATKKSTSFTDTITVKLGDYTQDITSGTAFTIPKDWMNAISGTSAVATVTVTTKSGSTTIGSKSVNLTVTVPDEVIPSISDVAVTEAVTDVQNAFGSGVYVSSLSKLNVKISASGVYGSMISSIATTFNGILYEGAEFQTAPISKSGTLQMNVTVTDSRGRKYTTSKPITAYAYSSPIITNVSCISNGENTIVTVSGTVAPVTVDSVNKNTKALEIAYKQSTAISYGDTVALTIPDDSWVFSVNHTFAIDSINSTYDFRAILTDKLTSITEYGTTGKPVISRKARGTGVTIGGEALEDGFIVDNKWDAKFTGGIYAEDADLELLYNQWITGGTLPDIPASDDPFILGLIYGGTGADNRKEAITNLSYLGENPIISIESDTVDSWKALGTGYCLITIEDLLNNQPATLGILQNYVIGNNVAQLWFTQPNGDMARRGGDSNGWDGTWRAAGSGSGGGGFVPNDYIIDSGVDGIWTWRKWNSGIAECWGQKSNSTPANTAQNIDAFPFPFTFAEPPSVNVGCTANGADYYRVHNLKNYTTTTTMRLTFINKYTSADDITAEIYVQGLWKEFNPGTTLSQPVTPNIETKTLLWENPAPTSDFAAQTVALDLSDYDACRVLYIGINTEGAYLKSVDVPVGKNGRMDLIMGNAGYQGTTGTTFFAGGRNFIVNTSGIEFKAGYRYASTTADNRVCIPVEIYGLKTITAFNRSTDVDYYISPTEYTELELLLNNGGSADTEPTLAMAYYDTVYPIGSVLTSIDPNFDPNTQYEGQTWEKIAEGRVLMGADGNHAIGTTAEAGLPNITGTARPALRSGGYPSMVDTATGAFYRTDANGYITSSSGTNTDSNYKGTHIHLDASRSNPIYGNSDTVQPPAYFVYHWKRTA